MFKRKTFEIYTRRNEEGAILNKRGKALQQAAIDSEVAVDVRPDARVNTREEKDKNSLRKKSILCNFFANLNVAH